MSETGPAQVGEQKAKRALKHGCCWALKHGGCCNVESGQARLGGRRTWEEEGAKEQLRSWLLLPAVAVAPAGPWDPPGVDVAAAAPWDPPGPGVGLTDGTDVSA